MCLTSANYSHDMQQYRRLLKITPLVHFDVCVMWQFQRLAGATLLVFANKQDLPGALSPEDIKNVSHRWSYRTFALKR